MIETLEALYNDPEKEGIPKPGKRKDEGKSEGDQEPDSGG